MSARTIRSTRRSLALPPRAPGLRAGGQPPFGGVAWIRTSEGPMIAVTCPTGQVSVILVPRLLRRGHPVRVLCHSSHSIDELTALGAQVRRGDLCVPEGLYSWLRGALATVPPIPIASVPDLEAEMGRIVARALANSAVMHVLMLSLAGCDRSRAVAGAAGDAP